jgi:hypothetical protein
MLFKDWSPRFSIRQGFTQLNWNYSANLRAGDNPVIMTLSKTGSLNAVLQDQNGKPLKDADLSLYAIPVAFDPDFLEMQLPLMPNWRDLKLSGSADAEGRIKIENAPEGVYMCIASASGFRPLLQGMARVREGQAAELPAIKLQPAPGKGQLTVLLQKSDGSPLKKTSVTYELEPVFEGVNAAEKAAKYRSLRSNMEMRRNNGNTAETDDDGKLLIDDVDAGSYQLRVAAGNEPTQAAGKVSVTGGASVDMGVFKFQVGGSIKGRLAGLDPRVSRHTRVFVIRQDTLDLNNININIVYSHRGLCNSVQTQQDGTYEIKKVPAGVYVVCFQTNTGRVIFLCGVEVSEGRETTAPDATLPDKADAAPPEHVSRKGTVTLPDGSPAANLQVRLLSASSGGSSDLMANDKGVFDLSGYPAEWFPARLTIRHPGYKIVSMLIKGDDTADLKIRLEKQLYGTLRVKVVDEQGQPLGGASVWPVMSASATAFYQARYGSNQQYYKPVLTDEKGEARLAGLSCGERSFEAALPDYYLSSPLKIRINPDAEQTATLTLKSGLRLAGKVELPAGADAARMLVSINNANFYRLKPNGDFCIEGLKPGKYQVRVDAPGWIAAEKPADVTLVDGVKESARVSIKLTRPAAVAVSFGAAYSGWNAGLIQPDSAVPGSFSNFNYATVDASGRAEITGLRQGKYFVALIPQQDSLINMQQQNRAYQATPLLGPVDALPTAAKADLASLKAVELKPLAVTASITARLTLDQPPQGGRSIRNGSLALRLTGPAVCNNVNFNYPYDFMANNKQRPLLQNPPPNVNAFSEAGQFSISNLLPGQYKIMAVLTVHNYTPGGEQPKPVETLLTAFSIKEGEKLDLGALKCDTPQTPQTEEEKFAEEGNDQPPGFQP